MLEFIVFLVALCVVVVFASVAVPRIYISISWARPHEPVFKPLHGRYRAPMDIVPLTGEALLLNPGKVFDGAPRRVFMPRGRR